MARNVKYETERQRRKAEQEKKANDEWCAELDKLSLIELRDRFVGDLAGDSGYPPEAVADMLSYFEQRVRKDERDASYLGTGSS